MNAVIRLSILLLALLVRIPGCLAGADTGAMTQWLLDGVSSVYAVTVLHEYGHMRECHQQGIPAVIRIGYERKKNTNGSSSFFLGKTVYESMPAHRRQRSAIALAGLEHSAATFYALNDKIQQGTLNGRWASFLALSGKLDFARYALSDYLRPDYSSRNDIELYCASSGVSRDFVRTAAVLDVLFDWRSIMVHVKTIMGQDISMQQLPEPGTAEIRPRVFIDRYSGISIGMQLRCSW